MKSYKQKLIQKLSEYHLARSSINVYLCSSADKRPRSDIVWELYLKKVANYITNPRGLKPRKNLENTTNPRSLNHQT